MGNPLSFFSLSFSLRKEGKRMVFLFFHIKEPSESVVVICFSPLISSQIYILELYSLFSSSAVCTTNPQVCPSGENSNSERYLNFVKSPGLRFFIVILLVTFSMLIHINNLVFSRLAPLT